MITPSFQEDHISQLPALQLLQNLGDTYLRPQEVSPHAELGERLRLDFEPGGSCSVLQDIRRFRGAFEFCQTVSGKSLATGICQPVAGKSESRPILQTVSRESGELLWNDTRRRRRDMGYLLTQSGTSGTARSTNPPRLSLDRRTRAGALFPGKASE